MAVAEHLDFLVQQVLQRVAADVGILGVYVLRPAVEIRDHNGDGRLLDGAGQPVKLLLGEALPGDVAAGGTDRQDPAGVIAQRDLLPGEPPDPAGRQPAVLAAGAVGSTLQFGLRGVQARGIVGVQERRDGLAQQGLHGLAELARKGDVGREQVAFQIAAIRRIGAGFPRGQPAARRRRIRNSGAWITPDDRHGRWDRRKRAKLERDSWRHSRPCKTVGSRWSEFAMEARASMLSAPSAP